MKNFNWMAGCLCFLLASVSFVMADEDKSSEGPSVGLGVEGGINLANLTGPNVNDVIASRLGFVGGAFLRLPLGSSLAIQPEILYAQKGGKFNGNAYQLDYVEIPILLDVTLIGPLGILLGPSFNANVANNGVANISQTDVGVILGAQLYFSRFLISGRYEVGLTDVSSNTAIQNGTFTFMAGLSFI